MSEVPFCQHKVEMLDTLMGCTGHEIISKYSKSNVGKVQLLPSTSSYSDSQGHSQLIPIT